MRYWYPRFDGVDLLGLRVGGPGLGNLLLTWARCHVKASAFGEPVIRPTWPQLKIGPLLRREADVRWYGDLFSPSPFELGGLRRAWLLLRADRVSEQAKPSLRFGGRDGWLGPRVLHGGSGRVQDLGKRCHRGEMCPAHLNSVSSRISGQRIPFTPSRYAAGW